LKNAAYQITLGEHAVMETLHWIIF